MGLEMVRVGANQKNIYIELNEVGINRISARPYKVDSDPMELFGLNISNLKKNNIFLQEMYLMENFKQIFLKINMF